MGYDADKKRLRGRKEKEDGVLGLFKGAFLGLGVFLVAFLVFWIGVSIIAYSCNDPNSVMSVFAFCAVYIASLIGGFSSAKINRGAGVVCGALCGVMMTFVLLLLSVLLRNSYSSGYSGGAALLLRSAVVLVSVVGGILGCYERPRRRRRR